MQCMRCECDDCVERKERDQEGNEFYTDDDYRWNKCDNHDEPLSLDRLDDECEDETLLFGKQCEMSTSELQLLKAAETKGKCLEVWAPVVESPRKARKIFTGLSSHAWKSTRRKEK